MEMNLMVKAVQDYVKRCMEPFAARMKSIEDRIESGELKGEKGDAGISGRDGIDGKDGAPGERGIDGINGKDGALGEKGIDGRDGAPGEKGADGINGKDGMPGERGDKGDPGERGEPGQDGAPGKDGADGKSGQDGERGLMGERGEKGDAGEPGQRGEKGDPGNDGKSITPEDMVPMLESVVGKWALDFERRAHDVLQRAIDKFPIPKDGRDALEIEDLSIEHDGDGGVTLRFVRGDLIKEFALRLPRFKVKGGYREGVEYFEGDGVSFGGSFYVSQKDAPIGKPGESEDWWLAAKKGRDGKDAKGIELPVRDVVRLS